MNLKTRTKDFTDNYELLVSLQLYPQTKTSVVFSITLVSAYIDWLDSMDLNYKIGYPSIDFSIFYLNHTTVKNTSLHQV